MSVQALAWVLEESTAEHDARLVLLSIANHADASGRKAWPSYDTIAKEAKITRRSAIRMIAKLEADNHVQVRRGEGPKGRNGRPTNLYEIRGMMVTAGHYPATVDGDSQVVDGDSDGDRLSPEPKNRPKEPSQDQDLEARPAPVTTFSGGVTEDHAYLAGRLWEHNQLWQRVTFGAVQRLIKQFGGATVRAALQRAWEEEQAGSLEVRSSPYALLESMCQDIDNWKPSAASSA